MKNYLQYDDWQIIEEGFKPENNQWSESIFSIGNGQMRQHAHFEENYSGNSLQVNHLAGVYAVDKDRWDKQGALLNTTNWIGIDIEIGNESLDLAHCRVHQFRRILNMKEGWLERSFEASTRLGKKIKVNAQRFCSIADEEIGAIRYAVTPLNFSGKISVTPYLDNKSDHWLPVNLKVKRRQAYIIAKTKQADIQIATGMKFAIYQNGGEAEFKSYKIKTGLYTGASVELIIDKNETAVIYKYIANLTSINHPPTSLLKTCQSKVKAAFKKGYNQLLMEQKNAWAARWESSNITIKGDRAVQQNVRFGIFQLHQAFIENKSLKEVYCLPFYLTTSNFKTTRNFLIYRYKQLQNAIKNAQKQGFNERAAFYYENSYQAAFSINPLEKIYKNGIIAYAIYDYIRYTNDLDFLIEYGTEMLIGIVRFWAQRTHYSAVKKQYVLHGVTGPNEYENNINNNWLTNYLAVWCMKYAIDAVHYMEKNAPERYKTLAQKIAFNKAEEIAVWKEICGQMYMPMDEDLGIFLQQEGFLDKKLRHVNTLCEADRPIRQKWSKDRILRSCFIQQADVLQGLYLFEDQFDMATIRRNIDFYESMTVHESLLSPCISAIMAAKIGDVQKAFELFSKMQNLTERKNPSNINIMAANWLILVKGIGGMRVYDNQLQFNPFLPAEWTAFSIKIKFRANTLQLKVKKDHTIIKNLSGSAICLKLYNKVYELPANGEISTFNAS